MAFIAAATLLNSEFPSWGVKQKPVIRVVPPCETVVNEGAEITV